jgi:hypothetical protein
MERNKQVLNLVNQKGPIIPSQISGEIGTNILLASAILSELVSENQLKVSSLKIGGSPLYYSEGQQIKLQEYTKYLNEKQFEAYKLLKEKKVLRDKELAPVVRVAIREIKDFAKPLEVSIENSKEIFWKWYLLEKEETEHLIKEKLGMALKKEVVTAQKKPPASKKPALKTGDFIGDVLKFFKSNGIEVLEQTTIKKNSEFEFVIAFPTPIGMAKYYCVAKSKKRCGDSDLNAAFARGEMRKLPTLFLTSGELTKKAATLLSTGLAITFKRI